MPGEGEDVDVMDREYWTHFANLSRVRDAVTGKYLFFPPDREVRLAIAREEVGSRGFPRAKVARQLLGANTEFVLCLYFADDSRKIELRDRYAAGPRRLKYRWWKADAETYAGMYSAEFRSKLPREDAEAFQKGTEDRQKCPLKS